MNGNTVGPESYALEIRGVLLPIREAYEWKLTISLYRLKRDLLPIREAYEWKPSLSSPGGKSNAGLASNS